MKVSLIRPSKQTKFSSQPETYKQLPFHVLLLSHCDGAQIKRFFLKQICLQRKFHGLLILQSQLVLSSVLDSIYQHMFTLCFGCSLSGFRGREGQWLALQIAASLPEPSPKCWKWEELEMGSAGSRTATSMQHQGGQGDWPGHGVTLGWLFSGLEFVFFQDAELCPKRPLAGSEMPQGF